MSKIMIVEVAPQYKTIWTTWEQQAKQIKFPGSNEWECTTRGIDGFTYAEGHHYVLEVQEYVEEHRLMDVCGRPLRLIRIISDTKV